MSFLGGSFSKNSNNPNFAEDRKLADIKRIDEAFVNNIEQYNKILECVQNQLLKAYGYSPFFGSAQEWQYVWDGVNFGQVARNLTEDSSIMTVGGKQNFSAKQVIRIIKRYGFLNIENNSTLDFDISS